MTQSQEVKIFAQGHRASWWKSQRVSWLGPLSSIPVPCVLSFISIL